MAQTTVKMRQIAGGLDGWIPAEETWAYASATTITVPSGAASKYSIGMRLKLTQTTVKYFIVTAVADTVLTVYGGTDYTVADAAISANYYSMVKIPQGFPASPLKWTYSIECGTSTSAGYVSLGTLAVPKGEWFTNISARASFAGDATYRSGDFTSQVQMELSTANNSFSGTYKQAFAKTYFNTNSTDIRLQQLDTFLYFPEKNFTSDGATTLYMVVRTTGSNGATYTINNGTCEFLCAYL